ncbi:MAG: biotin transporter BioY [Saccharofermentanales bacterium]
MKNSTMPAERIPLSAYRLSLSALFLALIIVSAFIRIPFPVIPITLQTLVVLLAAMTLGHRLAGFTVGTYLLMGLAGLPVFTAGGGIFYVFKPTFGYLIGFLLAAVAVGYLVFRAKTKSFVRMSLSGMIGIIIIYTSGIGYMLLLSVFYTRTPSSLASLFTLNFALTIFSDLFKCAVAAFLAVRLRDILQRSSYFRSLIPGG